MEDKEEGDEKTEKKKDKSEEDGDSSGDQKERLDEWENFVCFHEKKRPLMMMKN